MSLVLVVLGVVSFLRLELRFFPELKTPLVSIQTTYAGADPGLIESTITTPLENAIAGVANIDAINSNSSSSTSTINVRFQLGGDFDEQANDVRNRVAAVRPLLPVAAMPPVVTTGGLDDPVLYVDFFDATKTPGEIRDYVQRYVQPKLTQLPGVGSVPIHGGSSYAMRIWLNAEKMAAVGLTVADVQNALLANNISFPAGSIQGPVRNFSIISDTRLKTPQDFGNIILRQDATGTVRFHDIAKIELGYTSLQDAPMRVNGKDAIDLSIVPVKGASSITVADNAKKALVDIFSQLPPGMKAIITYDGSKFLRGSINETFKAIAQAIFLVVLVTLIFIGSIRAALVPIITIPVCVISVFGVMALMGFTINVMTLLGIVLAIGLVVDDAIVMLENIHRHIEQGESPMQAALKGSKEIAFAIVAMTLTLAAVYAPIGLAQGFTAKIFQEFAFTLAGAVLISGFVALTLSPMMCSRILETKQQENSFVIFLEKLFHQVEHNYQRLLQKLLHKRLLFGVILIVLALLGLVIYQFIPKEFVPKEDVGYITGQVTSPTGANVNYTDRYVKQIEKVFANTPDVQAYFSIVSGGSAQLFITLKPWGERKLSTQQIVNLLNPQLAKISGVDAYVSVPDPVQFEIGGHDFAINLMTTGEFDDLLQPTQKLYDRLKQFPGLTQFDRNLKYDNQQYTLSLNRNLAATLGVNIQDIATTASVMLGGAHVTDVLSGSQIYPVMLQMRLQDLMNFEGINKLYVRAANNQMVPLSSLVNLIPNIGQSNLGHYNRLRASTITAQLAPGTSISEAIDYTIKQMPDILKGNLSYSFDGKAQEYIESAGSMAGIFLLAIIFIYLVMAAQFGSFIDPFIILLTVPLSMVSALICLYLTGGTLNLYSQIGLVTLLGLITKHGILITQFANDLRAQGKNFYEAIIRAATIRLRPILMTTFAMVFGTLPLAFATGPGAVGRHQIGWVIVGGLTFGTFFSLIVVPIAYSYFGKFRKV